MMRERSAARNKQRNRTNNNNNNNNNNNIPTTMFIVLLSWQAIVRVHSIHVMNTAWRQVAANLWTKPTGLSYRPAYIGSQQTISTIASKLTLISPSYIGRRQSKSWWLLYTKMVYPPIDGHPSKY